MKISSNFGLRPNERGILGDLELEHAWTERVRNYFKKLVPMDVWFYDHAEKLFEERWIEIMSGGHELLHANPRHTTISLELPKVSCMSTRFAMKCKNPSFYHRLQRNLEIYSPLLLDDF